jgi:hypothetical protein
MAKNCNESLQKEVPKGFDLNKSMERIWKNYGKSVEPMENLWNMATYFPGSVGLVAYLTTRPRFVPRSGGVRETGKRHVFFENRKVTSINTSLILPH